MAARVVKKAAVRRAEVVDVAIELFARRGYEGTTVTDILQAVGMAKGGFYHHFASKDEVFDACVERLAEDLATSFVAVLQDAAQSPRGRILAYLRLGYTGGEHADRSLIAHDLHLHRGQDLHARVIDGVQERVALVFAETLAQGRDEGDFDFEGDPLVVSVAVIGMLRGLHERYAREPDAAERVPLPLVVGLVERTLGASTAIRSTG
ncbi:MAG: TetR/AcrR family transcriptional regulator [Micropruina sp.]|nr:TetR/AcrR family transcriptional regulator [Micropruina sp.]